jgi:DNA-binding transcriptional regulator GbsR (MarR family)
MNRAAATFIADCAALMSDAGLPPSTGRVLGFLLICEPDHQSASALAKQLELSAGSVSAAVTLLQKLQMVARVAIPNDRRHYYRIDPDYERKMLDLRRSQIRRGLTLAATGLKLSPGNPRLKALQHVYSEFDTFMSDLKPL